jgi:putative effector of murein hydrolase LrgA (UPF0299 family)
LRRIESRKNIIQFRAGTLGEIAMMNKILGLLAAGTLVVSIVTALIALAVIASMLLACLLSVLVPIYPFKWLSEKSRPLVRRMSRA